MADNTTKTTVEVEAKSKGFAKLRDETGNLNQAIKQGQQTQKRGFDELSRKSDSFASAMERAIRSVGKNREALSALRDIGRQFDSLEQKITRMEQSLKRADAARGAFFQGLAQGMGAGEFLQRGPGMRRQIAGRMVGQTLAAPGRTFAGGLFGGVGGLAQGLAGIPLVGGIMGGLMQNAMGFAGGALNLQQQRLGALPMLQNIAGLQRPTAQVPGLLSAAGIARQAQVFGRGVQRRLPAGMRGEAPGAMFELGAGGFRPLRGDQPEVVQEAIAGERRRLEAANMRMRRRAAQERMNQFFAPIREAGRRFGMAEPEALQFAGQLAQIGGPGATPQMLQTAMAAQRLGVGAGVSGAFLRAQRRGGLTGGPAGAEGLAQAIGDAMRMGLEGAEVPNFLRNIAEGIQQFEQTGIPINARSLAGMGRAAAGLGLGGIRGGAFARQLIAGGQRLGRTGPTSGVDVLALQTIGGFRGGGSEAILQAMERMEEGNFDPQGLNRFIRQVAGTAGPGRFGQGRAVRMALERIGVSVGSREARLLSTQAMGGQLSPEQRAVVDEERKRILEGGRRGAAVDTPKSIQNLAETMVTDFGPNIRRQADLQNKQLRQGEKLVDAMQDLQSATTAMAAAFTVALGPTLKELTGGIDKSAKSTEDFVRTMKREGVMAALADVWNL